MGATQSKKRRKDKRKKKRGSLTLDMPRSVSMDALRPPGVSPSPSACPLCPHCRSAISWSSDHSLTHSLCLYHARQGRSDVWDSEARHGRGEVWDKTVFDSCPDCYVPSSAQGLCLCEISNQGYDDEMSTMSLNRHFLGRPVVKPGGIVQSKSAEFAGLVSRRQYNNQTKENLHPDLCYSAGNEITPVRRNTTESYRAFTSAGKRRSASSNLYIRQSNNVVATSPLSSSSLSSSHSHPHPPPPPPPSSSSSGNVHNNNNSLDTKVNFPFMEDEEAMMSRWVKRKRMAQELRTLRMHLQNEEVKQQTLQTSVTSSVELNTSLTLNSNVNNNNNLDEKTVNEFFTPSTKTLTNSTNTTTANSGVDGVEIQHKNNISRSNTSTRRSSTSTDAISTETTTETTISPTRRSVRSKFSRLSNYRYLDNHPVMTRLQNEQNSRLELMERRMEEIRISAMQEAERRKFAEIFPAKNDDSETQKLLREARESLERMKEEKKQRALSQKGQHQNYNGGHQSRAQPNSDDMNFLRWRNGDSRSQDDSGEIIPVRVLSSSREATPVRSRELREDQKVATGQEKVNHNNQSVWFRGDWPDINLGKPLTWLWLPFLLFPLVLRMLVAMICDTLPASVTPRNGNSANTGCNTSDRNRNRNLSKHRRKKSC